jgi:DNA recombination protein RmuC
MGEREATTTELKAAIEAERAKTDATFERLAKLTGELAEARKEAEEVRHARQEAIAAKDREVERMLASKEQHLRDQLAQKDLAVARLLAEKDQALAAERRAKDEALAEQKRLLEETERVLTEKFGAVSLESLKTATDRFLELASKTFEKTDETAKADIEKRRSEIEQMLKPFATTLEKLESQNKEMEERRVSAFDAIDKGIKTLSQEADQLANALRKPNTRGAWGEMQLQVILENAGMQEGEHFTLQHSTEGDDGRLRTDVIIKLPKGRLMVIDSKAPLETYWDGMNAPDEATRTALFVSHARLVRDHVKKLSNKSYWSRYEAAPDCVVMFIPTEGAYQAAFESDRGLLGEAHNARVYIANPMTLISMVHVAAYILNEEKLRQNAQEVRAVGQELYKRLSKFLGDMDGLGRHLKMVVDDYNKAVGSVDSRLIPQARRMSQLGAGVGEVPEPEPIDMLPRAITSAELAFSQAALPAMLDDI